jgi:dimeric dUTPase (all-alpha-NTP-PPase superfamily)
MNLQKLFDTQKVLRDRIDYNEPDRFNKLVLALLVELGELANEQRSWKFWSKDKKPRVRKARKPYMNLEDAEFYNPLLEEFVDGLHFVLELGIEVQYKLIIGDVEPEKYSNVTEQFLIIYETVNKFKNKRYFYSELLSRYIALGEMLGFTWEQIESAYFEKNKINHDRQDSGY